MQAQCSVHGPTPLTTDTKRPASFRLSKKICKNTHTRSRGVNVLVQTNSLCHSPGRPHFAQRLNQCTPQSTASPTGPHPKIVSHCRRPSTHAAPPFHAADKLDPQGNRAAWLSTPRTGARAPPCLHRVAPRARTRGRPTRQARAQRASPLHQSRPGHEQHTATRTKRALHTRRPPSVMLRRACGRPQDSRKERRGLPTWQILVGVGVHCPAAPPGRRAMQPAAALRCTPSQRSARGAVRAHTS